MLMIVLSHEGLHIHNKTKDIYTLVVFKPHLSTQKVKTNKKTQTNQNQTTTTKPPKNKQTTETPNNNNKNQHVLCVLSFSLMVSVAQYKGMEQVGMFWKLVHICL